ncbi:helix-turn-helix domain-containing protein [Azospirillum sp. B4]|uniref:helix-turn-helix domain-containing protein n=1 Tax=Azospirillum sp. B4 TaxID=95605 RepID=UPI0006784F35|nr:helix-turn-helix domain-containing protein [Azospirillum sp. B4]
MPRSSSFVQEARKDHAAKIGNQIRVRRTLLGLSQSELARMIGVTFQQVQKYERGQGIDSLFSLLAISQALDVPLSFMLQDIRHPALHPGGELPPDREQSLFLTSREGRLVRNARKAPAEVLETMEALLRAVAAHVDGGEETTGGEELQVPHEEQLDLQQAPDEAAPDEAAMVVALPARRRRGAIWDPADIGKAGARQKSRAVG